MTSQHFSAWQVPSGLGAGSRLAGYLLEEQIGEGGMAVVFRAHEERLGRTVALKVLAPALASDEGFRQRFARESRAAAAVDDPHIIPVFEAGEAEGVLFIAMRFVRGGDVRSLIARLGFLPAERAMSIISQAASALDAAHGRGLVHRDVKPANMLLDRAADRDQDHVYLSDFGLSKPAMHSTGLTGTGMFLGTLDYVSPEQIDGRPVDGRADQYSLACAAYEMLCGMPPFRREQAMALMYAQMNAVPPRLSGQRPGLPAGIDDAFARALAKSPADRFGSCTRFADAVRQSLGENLAGAPTTEAAGPPRAAWRPPQASPPRPPTEVVQAGRGVAAGTTPTAVPRQRRLSGQALLIGACILAAAGVISGAILLHSQPRAAPKSHGSASAPLTPDHGSGRSEQARSSSPIATGGGQAPAPAGYRLAARLNPGRGSTSISGVAWSSVGPLIAASDKNGSTYLWNAATGAAHGPPLAGPSGPGGPITAYYTALSPNGSVVATGYADGSTYLRSTATGRFLARLTDPGNSNTTAVNWLAFSPDGQTLATADGNGQTNLWNVANPASGVSREASLTDPGGTGVYSVAFGANGLVATGDYYGHVYLWDIASDSVTASFSVPGGSCTVSTICDAVSGLAFSRDGGVLAAASINGNAELWSVSGSRAAAIQTASQGSPAIWGMSFAGDRTLAIACANGRVNLWQVSTAGLSATLAGGVTDRRTGNLGVGAVTVSADGRYLVAGDTNGSAYLWKLGGAGSAQSWTSASLVITQRSLGAVTIGMTTAQASAAAGQALAPVGDGVWYPGGKTAGGLSVRVSGSGTVSCVSVADRPGGPSVVTPQGFRLGETLAMLKAVYGGRIRYVPAPAGGIMPLPGYVVAASNGNLVFWVRNGIVDRIAGGPGILPSTDCV